MVTKFVAPDAAGTAPEQASSDRITQFIETLKEQGIEYVRFEMPDLHGMSRSKVVPIDKVEGYTRKGFEFLWRYVGVWIQHQWWYREPDCTKSASIVTT